MLEIYPDEIINELEEEIEKNSYELTRKPGKIILEYVNLAKIEITFNEDNYQPTVKLYNKNYEGWPEEPYRIVEGLQDREKFFNFLENCLKYAKNNYREGK